jgi:Flp pilus assembly protein TadD/opacity protein-like surface antigen
MLMGAIHFISRVPRTLKVTTPFVDGTVEGTEFMVSVTGHNTSFIVFEGQVLTENDGGSLRLTKGQSAIASSRQQAPTLQIVVRPRDAVQWSLYYAPVLYYNISDFPDSGNTTWQAMTRNSIQNYWKGDLYKAFSSIEQISEKINDPRFFNYRALLLLTAGRVDEARLDIEQALKLTPGNSDSNALLSIISVVQNDKENALKFAKKAVDADPGSAGAHIALSYAQQAVFDLDNALKSVQTAADLEPSNVLARARLAELWLSRGYLNKAVEEAREAVNLNSNNARAQSVLGFAYLTQIKTKKAKKAFEKAIKLDSADPLSRFGLGLAKIRTSIRVANLKEGRREIEIAASLDPNNSLIRSYLGKAYFDEKRDKLASEQFDLAGTLDPKDPTPFFYNAIRKQTVNRPVEALYNMQKSIELNNNRAVYRSKFLLDEDLAARSASAARIYRDLGFQQRALFEGWRSLNVDPASYSAHRFLADSYSALPRHEIARVSELLQSQLLQPINITPVQPQLAESNLFILEGAGPAAAAFNEFNPLFNRNRLALQASGILADKDTQGDDIVQSGVLGRTSYSLSQYHYETDGFRKNNNLNQDIYDAFFQINLSHKTSVQAEYRYLDDQRGDLSLRFDQDNFDNISQNRQTDTVRLGLHHSFTPYSKTIASFIYQNVDNNTRSNNPDLTVAPPLIGGSSDFKNHIDENGWTGEIRHLYQSQSGRFYVTGGLGRFSSDRKEAISINLVLKFPFPIGSRRRFTRAPLDQDIRHTNFYIYSLIKSPEWITRAIGDITWTIGGSMDFFEGVGREKHDQFNPKVGLTWNPFPNTTIRGAVFKTLKRQLLSDQTIEPTQVAGFNQFFDDTNGSIAWRYGAAIDQKFSKSLYGGAEYSRRDLDIARAAVRGTSVSFSRLGSEEDLIRAYLYWTPHDWLSMSAEYQYEWIEREPSLLGIELFEKLKTHRVPLGITFFHPSGFSARLKSTYVDQEGDFADTPTRTFTVPGDDNFWYFDGSISYRLPKNHGIISIGAKNLFNKNINFQDTDPTNPQIVPEQFIFARFTLSL